jgi:hypothetical protein
MELSSGTVRIQIDDVLSKGDRVVVLCTEAQSAAVEVGHRRKFTSGPSGITTRRFSGSTKATNRLKTSSGQRTSVDCVTGMLGRFAASQSGFCGRRLRRGDEDRPCLPEAEDSWWRQERASC